MRSALLVAFGTLVALVVAPFAHAGPGLVVGAVEDDVRTSTLVEANARMADLRLSGFRAVRITSFWRPGQAAPSEAASSSCRKSG